MKPLRSQQGGVPCEDCTEIMPYQNALLFLEYVQKSR